MYCIFLRGFYTYNMFTNDVQLVVDMFYQESYKAHTCVTTVCMVIVSITINP